MISHESAWSLGRGLNRYFYPPLDISLVLEAHNGSVIFVCDIGDDVASFWAGHGQGIVSCSNAVKLEQAPAPDILAVEMHDSED